MSDNCHMTPEPASVLVTGMKPWKLFVDWCVQQAYPDEKVEVILVIMGGGEIADPEQRRTLRRFATIDEATAWAVKYVIDRGHRPLLTRTPERALAEGALRLAVHAGPRTHA